MSEKNVDFKVIVSIKLFSVLKVFSFELNRRGIKVFNKNIEYKKFITEKDLKKINRQTFEIIKKFNIEFDKIYFTLKIGLIDTSLTNVAIVVLSSIFPILIKGKVKRKNVKYEILPNYDKLSLDLKGKINISIKGLTLLKLYFKNIKHKIAHNKNENYGVKVSF